MLKITTFLLLFFSSIFILAQAEYNMQNATVTDCSGILYDSGGENGEYSPNEDFTFTICPEPVPTCIQIDFGTVQMETNFDQLEVFDGPNTSSPQLLFHSTGLQTLPTIKAYSGCITVLFTSDTDTQLKGWKATWNCFEEDCPTPPTIPNEQDCEGAIIVCQDIYSNEKTYIGEGNIINEINTNNTCLLMGEKNSVWYKLNVNENGNLAFSIVPNNLEDDYDWIVFNITDAPCSEIGFNTSLLVSCNYSSDLGMTGPTGATNQTSAYGEDENQNAKIPVKKGDVYAINISQYSVSEDGFTIDFSDSSIKIGAESPPSIGEITDFLEVVSSTEIQLRFSEDIPCSVIEDLDINMEGHELTHTTLCNELDYAQTFIFEVSPKLTLGTYELNVEGEIADMCGNTRILNESIEFEADEAVAIPSISQNPIHLYPNPSQHTIFVEIPFTSTPQNTLIEVYGLTGQKLQSVDTADKGKVEIDVSDYPKGIYYLKVKIGERTWIEKVTIQ